MLTKELALTMIDWIIKEGAKLNEWEVLFIKSIQQKSLLAPLSTRQEAIINKIYDKWAKNSPKCFGRKQVEPV